jgi:hypothetical protein
MRRRRKRKVEPELNIFVVVFQQCGQDIDGILPQATAFVIEKQ